MGDVVALDFVNYGTNGAPALSPPPTSTTVSTGVEFAGGVSFDIEDSAVLISSSYLYFGPTEFDTYTLSDLDFNPPAVISGVSFGLNQVPGLDLSDVTFGPDWVRVVLDGTVWDQVNQARLLIATTPIPDTDGDGVYDDVDNCIATSNPAQEDADGDSIGDACDLFPNDANHARAQCLVDLGDSNSALYRSQAELAQAQSDLAATSASLQQCQGDLGASQSSLVQTQASLNACQVNLGDSNAALYQSQLDLAQATTDLAVCQAQRVFADADSDGEDDATDRCAATTAGTPVDGDGCSRAEFCTAKSATCKKNDWMNDEPGSKSPGDCIYDKRARTCS
jgi:hypothetical protein